MKTHVHFKTLTQEILLAGLAALTLSTAAAAIPPAGGFTFNYIDASCGNCDGVATVSHSNPSATFDYAWSSGDTGPVADNLCPGIHSVTVSFGTSIVDVKQFTINAAPCDSVWPGDADYDGTANKLDILAIGQFYGASGPPRTGAATNWTGQVASNWVTQMKSGVNLKHLDANGDGVIDQSDADVIASNYKFDPIPAPTTYTGVSGSTKGLNLYSTVSLIPSGHDYAFQANIHLDGATAQTSGVYGLSFTLDLRAVLDPLYLDPNSVQLDLSTSWLGTIGQDLIGLSAYAQPMNRVDIGLSRTDQVNAIGNGIVCVYGGITSDQLDSKDLAALEARINNQLRDVTIVDSDGNKLEVTVGVPQIEDNLSAIQLFPNPASSLLTVKLSAESNLGTVYRVINVQGKVVQRGRITGLVQEVDVTALPADVYILELQGKDGLRVERFAISR